MAKLGPLLVTRGWITEGQLVAALRRQQEIGGRLGTCLLELGSISEGLLLKALGEQLSVPVADVEDLEKIPQDVHSLLEPKHAGRYKAIPFRKMGGRVDIALLDVSDLTLVDELSFVIGKQLRLHIANEARILEALQTYYGIQREPRFNSLIDRLNRDRKNFVSPSAQEPKSGIPSIPEIPGRHSSGSISGPAPIRVRGKFPTVVAASVNDDQRATPEATAARAEPPAAARQIGTPPTVAELESRLGRARDPEEIGAILLDLAAAKLQRVLLFRVRQDKLEAWMGRGSDLSKELFESFEADFNQPSAFLNLQQGSPFYVGSLGRTEIHQRLAETWGGALPETCALAPVRIGGRMIAVIYGDPGDRGVESLDIEWLRELAEKASEAFELCIMRRKLRGK